MGTIFLVIIVLLLLYDYYKSPQTLYDYENVNFHVIAL